MTFLNSLRTSATNVRARVKESPILLNVCCPFEWQARRDSNPQPPVLETGALPIELLAYGLPPQGYQAASSLISFPDAMCVSGRSGSTS